jgi:hypothetical protein
MATDLQREWNSTLEQAFGTQTDENDQDNTSSSAHSKNQHLSTRESSGSPVSQEKWLDRQGINNSEM